MTTRIRTAAVLGAGTMGAQIAAHLANAGVGSILLDLTREAAREGFERARAIRPDPFFTPSAQALVRTGSFDDDLASIATCDWIIEAIVERLDIKQSLSARSPMSGWARGSSSRRTRRTSSRTISGCTG